MYDLKQVISQQRSLNVEEECHGDSYKVLDHDAEPAVTAVGDLIKLCGTALGAEFGGASEAGVEFDGVTSVPKPGGGCDET